MGCGSSGNVVTAQEDTNSAGKVANGKNNGNHHEHDDLPTVVLPDTPMKPKPPGLRHPSIAFEIPIEELDPAHRPSTPPAHLLRLLQPPQSDISLPDIEEKLADAEQRRNSILQQRAASAQKRTQKIVKSLHEVQGLNTEYENMDISKHVSNTLTIPQEPGVCEGKNI